MKNLNVNDATERYLAWLHDLEVSKTLEVDGQNQTIETIKDYIKWDAEERGLTPTDYKGRTSKAVREWFEHGKPEKIMAFMSGSQGNPIEIESMTYRLADGLSHFDADPKHRSTARSLKMKDLAVIISQSAIPGNAKYQKRMIKKLAGRGCIVLEAYRDNLRVHISRTNPVRQRILNDIAKMGRTAVIEADGAIVVEDFPIHASVLKPIYCNKSNITHIIL